MDYSRVARKLRERIAVFSGELLKMASGLIGKDTLLMLDPTDIRKKYAKKMQYLAGVHDGSEDEVGNGYWLLQVVAAEVEGDSRVPLLGRLYSTVAPGHVSENKEILDAVDMVAGAVKKRGIWVIDRGGDRRNLMVPMLSRGYRFLIRLAGNRNLIWDRQTLLASEIARNCPCPYAETIVKVEDGKEKVYHVELGFRQVRLPGRPETLGLVVAKGFGAEPMMLLTTGPVRKNRKALWRLVRSYIRRWAIEETIRFIKQSYDIEDVRVLGYRSLRNLMTLVLAVSYFAAVVLDTGAKLKVMAGHVLKAAKRVSGIPDFHYYAIADGLMSIFMRYPGRILQTLSPCTEQAALFPSDS